MITIKNVKTLDGQRTNIHFPSEKEHLLNGETFLLMPGLIDSHICCGPPSHDHWEFVIRSLLRGGVTGMIDIPSANSFHEGKADLEQRQARVREKLQGLRFPLNYFFYGRGNIDQVDEIGLEKGLILGSILLFEPGNSLLDDREWERIFQLAAWEDFPVVINSRNENSSKDPKVHSSKPTILEKAIFYAEKQNTRLYVLNVSSQEEIELIEAARRRSLLIYTETTPQHLFPWDGSSPDLLWEALNKGIIETIGSGFNHESPVDQHILFQGTRFDALNPAFLLPRLLTAHHEGKISLENIVRATRVNLFDILKIHRKDQDQVLVDLQEQKLIKWVHHEQETELTWKGWPVCTIINGELFNFEGQEHFLDFS